MMTSRWAYEALAVNQFKNNRYEQVFFDVEKEISNASFKGNLLVPELIELNSNCYSYLNNNQEEALQLTSQLLISEIRKLKDRPISHFPEISFYISGQKQYTEETYQDINEFLKSAKKEYHDNYNEAKKRKDMLNQSLVAQYGSKEAFLKFKKQYQNEALEELVLNKRELKQIEVTDQYIIQKRHPIFKEPISNWGRAHFYSPSKRIMGLLISTPVFNIIIIWIGICVFYVTLYLDLLRRIIRYFETFKLRRLNQRLQKIRP